MSRQQTTRITCDRCGRRVSQEKAKTMPVGQDLGYGTEMPAFPFADLCPGCHDTIIRLMKLIHHPAKRAPRDPAKVQRKAGRRKRQAAAEATPAAPEGVGA